MSHTHVDAHGNPMTGDPAAIALYDRSIDRLLRFHPEVVELAGTLADLGADAPMASALNGWLQIMSTDPADLAGVTACVATLRDSVANVREQAHADALAAWAAGDWHGSAAVLDEVLQRWPSDLLALMLAHQLDFFVGDAATLRDRPLRSLMAMDGEHPHTAFVRGMAAFGLEEAGHYEQAREHGLAAIAANPDDVWAIHAVTHTYEMQGRVADGIEMLRSDRTQWESGNLFTVHNWWHLALFELEAGRLDVVFDIYDTQVHSESSAGVPMEMLDASALLWRLHLDGVDTGERFQVLADAWAPKLAAAPWYAFNDFHAVMALVGAGRLGEARVRIDELEAWLPTATGSNAAMTADVGLPSCRALVAFAEERHDDVVDELLPVRRFVHRFGGSHAERDVVQRTLLESALRSGRYELARSLNAERLGTRPASVYGWSQQARIASGIGDDLAAASASREAGRLRAVFAVS